MRRLRLRMGMVVSRLACRDALRSAVGTVLLLPWLLLASRVSYQAKDLESAAAAHPA